MQTHTESVCFTYLSTLFFSSQLGLRKDVPEFFGFVTPVQLCIKTVTNLINTYICIYIYIVYTIINGNHLLYICIMYFMIIYYKKYNQYLYLHNMSVRNYK